MDQYGNSSPKFSDSSGLKITRRDLNNRAATRFAECASSMARDVDLAHNINSIAPQEFPTSAPLSFPKYYMSNTKLPNSPNCLSEKNKMLTDEPKRTTNVVGIDELSPVGAEYSSIAPSKLQNGVCKSFNSLQPSSGFAASEQPLCYLPPAHHTRSLRSEKLVCDNTGKEWKIKNNKIFGSEKDFRASYGSDASSSMGKNNDEYDVSESSNKYNYGLQVNVSRKKKSGRNKLKRKNLLNFSQNIHTDNPGMIFPKYQEVYCNSSSDENKSSGHASMSESHSSNSPMLETLSSYSHNQNSIETVPEDEKSLYIFVSKKYRSNNFKDSLKAIKNKRDLDDIKENMEQLSLQSQNSNSTSTYSSNSGADIRLNRRRHYSSMDTIHTGVTLADDFVWLNSNHRLIELQNVPWTIDVIFEIIHKGRLKSKIGSVSTEVATRISYLFQHALVRISREIHRLSHTIGMCTKKEVATAFQVILSPAIWDSCRKACVQAATMYAVPRNQFRVSKSSRAGIYLSVGKFQSWMIDMKLAAYIHEHSAVYLAAGMECLMEEIFLLLYSNSSEALLKASVLENTIASNGELWGLLQPYVHLNAGRNSSGNLTLPRWPSNTALPTDSAYLEQCMLATCADSMNELSEFVTAITRYHCRRLGSHEYSWDRCAINALFYFLKCPQVKSSDEDIKECREFSCNRPYLVMPPLAEWIRVATAHCAYRNSKVVDRSDVMQASRLLLPGLDCPIRKTGILDAEFPLFVTDNNKSCPLTLKTEWAFQIFASGRQEVYQHALTLLPPTKADTYNANGITPLMLSAALGDDNLTKLLLNEGANVNLETRKNFLYPETQYWTALTYACIGGHTAVARLLLNSGARVEGGAILHNEEKCTQTPLQLAAATGNKELVELLLKYGAQPFLSTLLEDLTSYSSTNQIGSYSPICLSAIHGKLEIMYMLICNAPQSTNKDMLSLEEILAEGCENPSKVASGKFQVSYKSFLYEFLFKNCKHAQSPRALDRFIPTDFSSNFTKSQIKELQAAMYHAVESENLELVIYLRSMGLPWTLYCWMQALSLAYRRELSSIIDQILQDFLTSWTDSESYQFADDCLPMLFSIFRDIQNESTSLLLADIFSTCFGKSPIRFPSESSSLQKNCCTVYPSYVNNPELSDVQFRVEGKLFYAHKIILVNASSRFKQMLTSKYYEKEPAIVHIENIRYNIFEIIMQYLYNGECDHLRLSHTDLMELLATANFFQLFGLVEICEFKCSSIIDLQNVVPIYIHAKINNAKHLMEYCQNFLLQNLVTLLTYDDSVRNLLFGNFPSYDILESLMITLKKRIKNRKEEFKKNFNLNC